ncbi:MAG TPA: MBL fold metallo-hydrolase [Gaiella sp.]|nr:MBL fold metallo-hydrolase [Gaiella sp.]
MARIASSLGALDVAARLFAFPDTCTVYALRTGRDAVLIDFGSGRILDHLKEFGVDRVTDVLVTHHHRDQVQGLQRAVDAGARIWVPPLERDLVEGVDEHWQMRRLDVDYDLREDRFSLLRSVPVAGVVPEYRHTAFGGIDVYTLPTPGHTRGSVTYLVELEGRRYAFTGDLLHSPGKVWSLAALQWSYADALEGAAATIMSCALLARQEPDELLPSHGEPMPDPAAALTATRMRLRDLVDLRSERPHDVDGWLAEPWREITPHLLRDRTTLASTYALLSESGAALLVDFGYDLVSHRPLLHSLDALREAHGVERIEVVVPTHFHDDHVAGINLLRDVEGTEAWVPENVAPVLEEPTRYDLPCLWTEPVPADRLLPAGEAVAWHEYELTTYPLPGHTLYAAAIAFEVDGRRVLATGDQEWTPEGTGHRDFANYYYRNRFRIDDYADSAELYRSLRPDLFLMGHSLPQAVTPERLERMRATGRRLADLHRELLPLEQIDLGAVGFCARIEPYRATATPGRDLELEVHVRNPFDTPESVTVTLVVPPGWVVTPPSRAVELDGGVEDVLRFRVTVGDRVRRARVAADVVVGKALLGQQAEALVDVR